MWPIDEIESALFWFGLSICATFTGIGIALGLFLGWIL